ncbi:MAG TPA: hypothetical protein VHV83_02500, partial [Armatimonadota bacterium]|nr:hypothetical protein [Armatimonadota bacterium]
MSVHRALVALMGLAAVLAIMACCAQAAPTPSPVPARPVEDFINSIGVNIHMHYTDTPYARFDDIILPKLTAAGIKHVRDGAVDSNWQPYYDRHQALAKAGIGCTFIFDATRPKQLETIPAWVQKVGDLEAFEGTNEIDLRGWADWKERTYDSQRRLYQAVKADP